MMQMACILTFVPVVRVLRGASLGKMLTVIHRSPLSQYALVVVAGGICDVTTKNGPFVTCNWENSEQAVAYIHGRLLSIKHFVTTHGVKVMFVRIPSMSLVQYASSHRIPTAAHKFQQDMVELVTFKVNELITAINAESFLSTISWDSDLIKTSKKKRGKHGQNVKSFRKFHYNSMYDGCHPDEKLRKKWYERLVGVVTKHMQ